MKSGCAGGRGFVPTAEAIVRRVFQPARKLVRFSLLKCPSIPNSKSSMWGSVSYGPSASPSYEASSHVNNYAYSGCVSMLITRPIPAASPSYEASSHVNKYAYSGCVSMLVTRPIPAASPR